MDTIIYFFLWPETVIDIIDAVGGILVYFGLRSGGLIDPPPPVWNSIWCLIMEW